MNLIIHKYYNNANEMQADINENANNEDRTIAYLSGKEDIMKVLKELIKTEYKVS